MNTTKNQLAILGKVLEILPITQGNEYKNQVFCITTIGDFPSTVAFTVWEKSIIYLERIQEGDIVQVFFNAKSRKNNEKYYSELIACKIDVDIQATLSERTKNLEQ